MKNRFDGEKTLYFVCAVLVSGLVLGSCSKLQNNVLVPVQSQSDIHPIGWTDITSQSFHGNYVKSQKFQTTICTSCHGSDLSGGTAQVSCYKCHQGSDGSLACNTCHGSVLNPAPPKDLAGDSLTSAPGVGAHQIHLRGSSLSPAFACSTCHIVPRTAGPGQHPFGGGATVIMSGLALTQTNLPGTRFYEDSAATVMPSPILDYQTLQCSNTYCHGDFKNGNRFAPTWNNVGSDQDSCGSCHGLPPHGAINGITPTYQGPTAQNCFFCHTPMMGPNGIQDSSLHVNGELEVYGRSQTSW